MQGGHADALAEGRSCRFNLYPRSSARTQNAHGFAGEGEACGVAKAEPAKAEPPKDAAKAEPAKDVAKADAAKAEPAKAEPAKAEPGKDAPKAEPAKDAEKSAEAPKAEAPPAPKPKPAPVAPPPPAPEPDLIDQLTSDPLYMAGGAGVLAILGVGGYVFVRRRRAKAEEDDDAPAVKSKQPVAAAAGAAAMAVAPVVAQASVDDVDPLAEADLYLNFGRDTQAEEVLKDALAKNPNHEEAKLKLLQIYAGRKDKESDRKSTRLNSSHIPLSRMPSSA